MKKIAAITASLMFLMLFYSCARQNSPTAPVIATAIETLTPANTPTAALTATETGTPQNTATATPTATATGTEFQPETATGTATFTGTYTETAVDTETPTVTQTATLTFTATETLTATEMETQTWTLTQTPSPTVTATATITLTSTHSHTDTVTKTITPTHTYSNTPTNTMTPTSTPNLTATMTALLVATWNGTGNAAGQWAYPRGISTDTAGNVYIAGINARFSKLSSTGTLLQQYCGVFGTSPGETLDALAIGVDSSGNVYTSDNESYEISKWSNSGTYLGQWVVMMGTVASADIMAVDQNGTQYAPYECGAYKYGNTGAAGGNVDVLNGASCANVQCIGVDRAGTYIYMVMTGMYVVKKYDTSFNFIGQWGSNGTNPGQFRKPIGVAADNNGNVYVLDNFQYNVQKFTSNGTFVMRWGSKVADGGQFSSPQAIACDDAGNVYVTDTGVNKIFKFHP